MAWPSGTKASTTNVDAGTDQPKLARADIKQNIDNVNSIIDTFDIASPNNGDILIYNSTSGTWETGTLPTSGTALSAITLTATTDQLVSGSTYRRALSEVFDPTSMVSISSTYQFTLAAGTYYMEPALALVDDAESNIFLYNETDASDVYTFQRDEIGSVVDSVIKGSVAFTIAGTKNFSLRQISSDPNNRDAIVTFKIFK